MRYLVGTSLIAASLAFSASALAEPSPSEIALARRLFSEALVLENAGNWSGAIAKLKDAVAIKDTPGLRYHLAHCQEQRGELVAASLDYERASELIRAGAKAPDVEELLVLATQRLSSQIPKITLTLPRGVSTATIEIDGHVVSPALIGKATPIDPGPHRVVARAEGRGTFEKKFVVGSGEVLSLELAMPPLAPEEDAAPAGPPTPERPNRDEAVSVSSDSGFGAREAVLVGEAALVAVGVGMGVGFTLARGTATDRARRFQAEIDAESGEGRAACSGSSPPLSACAELQEEIAARKRDGTFAAIGFIGAGVGAAAFVATWILWPSSDKPVAIQVRPRGVGWDLRAGVRF